MHAWDKHGVEPKSSMGCVRATVAATTHRKTAATQNFLSADRQNNVSTRPTQESGTTNWPRDLSTALVTPGNKKATQPGVKHMQRLGSQPIPSGQADPTTKATSCQWNRGCGQAVTVDRGNNRHTQTARALQPRWTGGLVLGGIVAGNCRRTAPTRQPRAGVQPVGCQAKTKKCGG